MQTRAEVISLPGRDLKFSGSARLTKLANLRKTFNTPLFGKLGTMMLKDESCFVIAHNVANLSPKLHLTLKQHQYWRAVYSLQDKYLRREGCICGRGALFECLEQAKHLPQLYLVQESRCFEGTDLFSLGKSSIPGLGNVN